MPNLPNPAALADLRADLAAARFTVDGVAGLLGEVAAAALDREQAICARRVLAAITRGQAPSEWPPLATLISLFLLGDAMPAEALAAALPRFGVEVAMAVGLVSSGESGLHPLIDLRPHTVVGIVGDPEENWWIAADPAEIARRGPAKPDHVLGVGGASLTLLQATVRTPVRRVLDLGTGCGIQALHAARYAEHVVATDISERALAFARFNAALNLGDDAAKLDLRLGSMLEPVAGEQFDLVVSNPPFVITPRAEVMAKALGEFEYRDGGQAGDELICDLIASVGKVLAPGGVAQFLGNWEHRAGKPWQDRLGVWLDAATDAEGEPLDAWVIQREVLDPAQYAETWIRDGGTTPDRDPVAWAMAYRAWLNDFAARDVVAVGFGIVTLRRPGRSRGTTGAGVVSSSTTEVGTSVGIAGERLRRIEEHAGAIRQPLGQHIAASLVAHDWQVARTDTELAAERLVVAADVTEERYFTPGQEDPNVIVLRQGDGLLRGVHASSPLAALVGACDGDLTLGELIGGIAHLYEVDAGALAAELIPATRRLIRDGFLTPQERLAE
ncbi:MAG: methyltransferase [Promicromonosporaceae bacterium]|nr:methyltransferase [Promicromonosporaceae bacterium]